MRLNSRIHVLTVAAGVLLLMATAAQAQRIHRWVDESGVVHYTDHPPPDSTRAEIIADIPKSNRPPPPPAAVPANETKGEPGAAKDRTPDDRQRAADRKKAEDAMRKAADEQTVSSCKARRDTFCGGGADVIRKKEAEKAWHQYDIEVQGRNRYNPNAPRTYGAPPKPPSVDRPVTTTPKKK
jgi:hypothetical protein